MSQMIKYYNYINKVIDSCAILQLHSFNKALISRVASGTKGIQTVGMFNERSMGFFIKNELPGAPKVIY